MTTASTGLQKSKFYATDCFTDDERPPNLQHKFYYNKNTSKLMTSYKHRTSQPKIVKANGKINVTGQEKRHICEAPIIEGCERVDRMMERKKKT